MSLIGVSRYGAEFAVSALTFAKATVNTYDVAAKSEQEPALKELEITLSELPKTNEFHIPFISKDLDFFRQPPLTEEFNAIDCTVWTPTHVLLKTGEERWRPDKIIDSYAGYHAYKRGNANMAGKVCHIYRPEAIDAKGNRVWCDMKIAAGEIVIVVPQKFLDSAVYPVVVDPTFGYTSIGGSYISGGQPWRTAGLFPLGEAGTLTKITSYVTGSGHLKGAVYSDVAGVPTARQGGGTDEVVVSGANWYDHSYSSGAPTLSVASWWLDEISDTAGIYWYYDSGGTSVWSAVTYANEPVDPFGSYSTRTDLISIYATYTTGATLQTVTDSLGLSDSVLRHKAPLVVSDSLAFADSILAHKTIQIVDALGVADSLLTDKTIHVTDTIAIVDSILGHKTIVISDALTIGEEINVEVVGAIVKSVTDALSLVDSVIANKTILIQDVLSILDAIKANKHIIITDSLTLADVIVKISGEIYLKIRVASEDLNKLGVTASVVLLKLKSEDV